jgi:hypothetical protein
LREKRGGGEGGGGGGRGGGGRQRCWPWRRSRGGAPCRGVRTAAAGACDADGMGGG